MNIVFSWLACKNRHRWWLERRSSGQSNVFPSGWAHTSPQQSSTPTSLPTPRQFACWSHAPAHPQTKRHLNFIWAASSKTEGQSISYNSLKRAVIPTALLSHLRSQVKMLMLMLSFCLSLFVSHMDTPPKPQPCHFPSGCVCVHLALVTVYPLNAGSQHMWVTLFLISSVRRQRTNPFISDWVSAGQSTDNQTRSLPLFLNLFPLDLWQHTQIPFLISPSFTLLIYHSLTLSFLLFLTNLTYM